MRILNLQRKFAVLIAVLTLGCCFGSVASAAEPLSWSEPLQIEKAHALNSVSCPSASFCATGSYGGSDVTTYNGSSWSAPIDIGEEGNLSVSCPSASFCMAVDVEGYAVTYNDGSWSKPVQFDNNFAPYDIVSCASASFCVATNLHAEAWTYNGSSWNGPVEVEGEDHGISLGISCVSVSFCVIVDNDGTTDIYNGSAWSRTAYIGAEHLQSVSCPSASFCATVSSEGYASIYNGSSWSSPVEIDNGTESFGRYINAVSCSSPSFCVAVDGRGYAMTYNGSTWSAPTDIDGSNFLVSVSCPLASFCVALDEYNALIYSAGLAPTNIGPPTISGSAVQGQILIEVHGEWSGNPTEYSYQWERCASSGSNCGVIFGAVAQNYLLTAADVGHTIRVTETAKNIKGHGAPTQSGPTAVVQTEPLPKEEEKETEHPGGGSGGGGSNGNNGSGNGNSNNNGGGSGSTGTRCTVPRLKGKTLAKARKLLTRNHCRLGKVSKPRRHSRHRLKVVKQKPRAGKTLSSGAKVAVRLGS